MIEILFGAGAAAGLSALIWLNGKAVRDRVAECLAAAQACALADVRVRRGRLDLTPALGLVVGYPTFPLLLRRHYVTASMGRLAVRLEPYQLGKDADHEHGTQVTVKGLALGPVDVRAESSRGALEKVGHGREIELGDGAFDSRFFVQGAPPALLALFDSETRLWASQLSDGRLRMAGDELSVSIAHTTLVPLTTLRRVLEFARRFEQELDVPEKLAANAGADRVAEVQLQCLLALGREYPDHPATQRALRAGLADEHPEIRLRAAMMSGEAGGPTLRELAVSAEVPDGCSARAIQSLAARLPAQDAAAVLRHALRLRRRETAQACMAALGRRSHDASIATLAKVLALEKDELAIAAVRALAATRLTAAEPPLLAALAHRDGDVRVAAAEALGDAGSIDAVLPLKEALARPDSGRAFQRAAREAIAAIQARAPGGSPGQLSLAADESGQLALVETKAGQVSLAEDDVAG